MNNSIIFNGKTYHSLEDMPPDARQAYEAAMGQVNEMFDDQNQDGIPDVFESLSAGKAPNIQVFSTSKIIFNGQVYDSVDEMPPEARQQYQEAFEDKNRDGVPDVFEQFGQANTVQMSEKVSRPPIPISPVHTAEGISPIVWPVLAGAVILILTLIIAGLVFLLII